MHQNATETVVVDHLLHENVFIGLSLKDVLAGSALGWKNHAGVGDVTLVPSGLRWEVHWEVTC